MHKCIIGAATYRITAYIVLYLFRMHFVLLCLRRLQKAHKGRKKDGGLICTCSNSIYTDSILRF